MEDSRTSQLGTDVIIKAFEMNVFDWKTTLAFRAVNKACNEAVANHFAEMKVFDAGDLLRQYFPEEAKNADYTDTMLPFSIDLHRFLSFFPMKDLVEVDLSCFATFNITQLIRTFRDTPCVNVEKLNLMGVVVSKVTWDTLARIFPNVTHIRVERQYIFFHTKQSYGPTWPVKTLEEKPLPPGVFRSHRELADQGYLDANSVYMMRCLKYYFKKARSFHLE